MLRKSLRWNMEELGTNANDELENIDFRVCPRNTGIGYQTPS
jgi:hypothetical protein